MDEFEAAETPAGGRVGGCLLQVVTHGLALVVGAGLGIGGARLAEYYANPEMMSRPEGELSRAELIAKLDASERAYAQLLADTSRKEETQQSEIVAANQKVTDLSTAVKGKEEEVKLLELKVKKSQGKSAALKKELESKQAELEGLKTQLETALAEKAQLEQDLVVSREETKVARQETEVAKGETVDARWEGFKSDAVVQICEKGNRNKLARCKEDVRASLDTARAAKFKQCVASRQATPRLVRVDDKVKDPEMPRWSEWVDQGSNFTKDRWYVTFCDPTLPEARVAGDDAPGEVPDIPDLGLGE